MADRARPRTGMNLGGGGGPGPGTGGVRLLGRSRPPSHRDEFREGGGLALSFGNMSAVSVPQGFGNVELKEITIIYNGFSFKTCKISEITIKHQGLDAQIYELNRNSN